MDNKNISLNKNRAGEPGQETRRAKRDMERIPRELFIEEVAKALEGQRRKRRKC